MSQGLKRLAVVIGNTEYEYLKELPNAVPDAEAVRDTLESLGFEVAFGVNKGRKEIFVQLRESWKNEASEIVFYFSGHGVSVDGKVYLGPVEAEIDLDFIDEHFLGVEKIIKFFLNNRKDDKYPIIIILDCCRSTVNVGRTRGYGQDPLQRMRGDNNNTTTNMTNVAILYSTADGQVAQDGNEADGNSPYTKLLLENIKKNYAISEIHSEIVKSLNKVKGGQTPWIYQSLHEPYKFFLTKSSISFDISVTVKEKFHGVPYENNGFINRPKIITKMEKLLSDKSEGNILALCGLGGMGKTELTLHYCYLYRDTYKYVFWLEADGLVTTLDSFRKLAVNLGLDKEAAMEISDVDTIIELVRDCLKKIKGWLLLLNNAGDPKIKFERLPRIGGDIILTTREHISSKKAKIITVGKMEEEEALSLLLGTAEMNYIDHEDLRYLNAKAIVTELDSMALAVDLARAYFESMSIAPEKYLTMFNSRRENLFSYQDKDNLHQYNHSLKTVWQLSFDRIRTQSALAAEFMRICSFLHSERIPTSLFEQQYTILTSSSSVSVISETSTKSLNAVQEAISILVKSSFATKTSTSDNNNGYPMDEFLTIHRLVQKVIHDELSDEQKTRIANNLSKALKNEIYFSDPYTSSTRAKMNAYLSHIRHFSGVLNMDKTSLLSKDLWELLMDTVRYLLYNEEYFGVDELAVSIVPISEAIHGPEDPLTVTSLYYQARIYKYQGNYAKAEPLYQRALDILEKIRGPKHLDTAASLDNLALLYKNQGDYTKAKPLYKRALGIRENMLGSNHPDTAASLDNLALLYKNQSNYTKAELFYKRALAIRENVLGSKHPDTATSLNNLASLYDSQGDYAKAESFYQRSLAINGELRPEHPDMATSLNNLALLYEDHDDYTKAEPLYQRALEIQERVLGPEHLDTAVSLNNLASLYDNQRNYAQAEPLYRRALAIKEKVLGPEHLSTAISLNNLSLLYKNQNNYAKSEPLCRRALDIRVKLLGPEHLDTVKSLNNLASLYDSQGDYANAKSFCQRALKIQEKVLGPEHPDTVISLNNLALLYYSQSNFVNAELHFQRVLEIQEKVLGPEHPDTVASLNNLANLYNKQGNYTKAEPLYQRAQAIQEKMLGPEHPDTAVSLDNLANLYYSQGNYIKAEPLYQRTLEIFEKVLGSEHPNTVACRKNLAELHNKFTNVKQKDKLTSSSSRISFKSIFSKKN